MPDQRYFEVTELEFCIEGKTYLYKNITALT